MWYDFRWIDQNESAIGDHRVSTDECEWVVTRYKPARLGERFVVNGQTKRRRNIRVIFEMDDEMTVFVNTAYPVK